MTAPRRLPRLKQLALRGRSCRLKALAQARLYLDVKEHPPGSNRGPHIERWQLWANGLTGYAWCAAFVCGMYREACGLTVPEPKRAAVGFLEAWAKSVGSVLQPGTRPRPGDLICYRFDDDDWPDHIGIVDRSLGWRWIGDRLTGRVRTIEGNTSPTNDANGGAVMVRHRDVGRIKVIRLNPAKLTRAKA